MISMNGFVLSNFRKKILNLYRSKKSLAGFFWNQNVNSYNDQASRVAVPRESFGKFKIDRDISPLFKNEKNIFFIQRRYKKNSICTIDGYQAYFYVRFFSIISKDGLSLYLKVKGVYQLVPSTDKLLELTKSGLLFDIKIEDAVNDVSAEFVFEVWQDLKDFYKAPCRNLITMKLWKQVVRDYKLLQAGKVSYLNEILEDQDEDDCRFDVDLVYTWVNSEDPDWIKLYNKHAPKKKSEASGKSRFYNRDELKYSLRSVAMYMPWVRKIHIISNCKAPSWIDLDNDKIEWVTHEEIFPKNLLPNFNSHAIESNLHRIKDLANHFIYLNDDVLITRPAFKEDFYLSNGLVKLTFEPYGNVCGRPKIGDPDYLNAARNGQRLIKRKFGMVPTQLHTHSPLVLRKDILEKMEEEFRDEFVKTAKNKFRKAEDLSIPSFLFPHYAYCSGQAIKANRNTLLLQQNHRYVKRFREMLADKNNSDFDKRYLSLCINDGADSYKNQSWNIQTLAFLQKYYSETSAFEKPL